MRLAKELLNLPRSLMLGVSGLAVLSNLFSTILALVAWSCLLLLLIVYLFDVVYHSIGSPKLASKVLILLRLFYKGLTVQKHQNIADVKGYYTNEQYDWINDVKFPEKILHDRRRDTMTERARTYIGCSKVLDLGCGTGLITQVLSGSVTGVDISPWKVERARQHLPHVTFTVDDVENLLTLPANNCFDAVVCTDVLEHLENPDRAIAEAWRVLKPTGVFIGTVPSRHIIWKLRRFLTTADASGEPFHIHYTKQQLRRLLQPFNVLEISSQCLGLELFFAATKEETPK